MNWHQLSTSTALLEISDLNYNLFLSKTKHPFGRFDRGDVCLSVQYLFLGKPLE